eukprot:COSAG04_NODE_13571_length_600_cov_1.844311_2_plen_113_part_01
MPVRPHPSCFAHGRALPLRLLAFVLRRHYLFSILLSTCFCCESFLSCYSFRSFCSSLALGLLSVLHLAHHLLLLTARPPADRANLKGIFETMKSGASKAVFVTTTPYDIEVGG